MASTRIPVPREDETVAGAANACLALPASAARPGAAPPTESAKMANQTNPCRRTIPRGAVCQESSRVHRGLPDAACRPGSIIIRIAIFGVEARRVRVATGRKKGASSLFRTSRRRTEASPSTSTVNHTSLPTPGSRNRDREQRQATWFLRRERRCLRQNRLSMRSPIEDHGSHSPQQALRCQFVGNGGDPS